MTRRVRITLGFVLVAGILLIAYLVERAGRPTSPSIDVSPSTDGPQAPEAALQGSAPHLEPAAEPSAIPPRDPPRASWTFDLDIYVYDLEGHLTASIVHIGTGPNAVSVPAPEGHCTYRGDFRPGGPRIPRAVATYANLWSRELMVGYSRFATKPHRFDLHLTGPRFRGRAVDGESGQPVAKANLYVQGWDKRPVIVPPGRPATGPDGEFDLHLNLAEQRRPLSPYLRVVHPDYIPAEFPLPPSADPVELRLQPRQRFEGTVELRHGDPVARTSFVVHVTSTKEEIEAAGYGTTLQVATRASVSRWSPFPNAPRELDRFSTECPVETDGAGRFSIPLPYPGLVRGSLVVPGSLAQSLEVDTSVERDPLRIVLQPTGKPDARVRVVRAGGQPLRGVSVVVAEADGDVSPAILTATTDEDGWFDSSALLEGHAVRISLVGDPKGRAMDLPPTRRFFRWVVRHDSNLVAPSR
ncbi:MAG: carboxypeptidase-like regulatory domain-containing protein [Planctomycetota bacterium]